MAAMGPMMSSLASRSGARWAWCLYALALLGAPLLFGSSLGLGLLSQIGMAIIVCLSYGLLLGQTGMLSFGHAVYTGMGGFMAIHLLNRVAAGGVLPVSLIPLVGGLASLLLALPLGWLCTRRAGTPLAMITLGMGELVWALAMMLPGVFGGEGGISANRVVGAAPWGITFGPAIELYYLIALYTLVCSALLHGLTRTPLGRMLNAVRDNPQRVAFVGYNPQLLRYLAFVIAAFFAGVAGGLAALYFEIVSADVFSATRSGSYLLFTVLGGASGVLGPILGAVLMVLATVWLSELTPAWLLYLGLVFVWLVMQAPAGLAAWLAHLWRLARSGELARRWRSQLWQVLLALLTLAGATTLIELLYHLQFHAALGSELRWLGFTLDSRQALPWLAAALLSLCAGGLWARLRRRAQGVLADPASTPAEATGGGR